MEAQIKWSSSDWHRFFRPNKVENRKQRGALRRTFLPKCGQKDALRDARGIYS
ncbi:hypothetical protein HMPREF0908_1137 [Selenomonas flueggei ATCC 43531]|uniref:Uncharacterized protein n=1 Tax=Selenomonas flueggei ATCC 43531 TaxID=638302 RepID=C4V3P3_9FIRM|nr:hypothetical protein HMPREF0908_1137 [Selenomonas flueggei ATCC 43531]